MIHSIEELIKYNFDLCTLLGGDSVASELILLDETKKYPIEELFQDVPLSYKKFLNIISMNGKVIGYFELSPLSFCPQGIIENLKKANSTESIFWEYLITYDLFFVATNNENGIFISKKNVFFHEGEVLMINMDAISDFNQNEKKHNLVYIKKLAKNFEQFLLLCCNMNKINREIEFDESNFEEKKMEFFNVLKVFNVDDIYFNTWISLF